MAIVGDSERVTICGLDELHRHGSAGITHVLSILDPGHPDPADFDDYGPHRRLTLRFHDIIEPSPGHVPPDPAHVEQLLEFGRDLGGTDEQLSRHLLVHCHLGVSRSTAAVATIIAQHHKGAETEVFERLLRIRRRAWPNSRMIAIADDLLGRSGRLVAALRELYRHQIANRPEIADAIRSIGRQREIDMAELSG